MLPLDDNGQTRRLFMVYLHWPIRMLAAIWHAVSIKKQDAHAHATAFAFALQQRLIMRRRVSQ